MSLLALPQLSVHMELLNNH